VTQEQFERESRYRIAMTVAKTMLSEGLISKEEYRVIDTIFIEKYCPLFGGLYTPETVDTGGIQR
jgi:hypothetical protein